MTCKSYKTIVHALGLSSAIHIMEDCPKKYDLNLTTFCTNTWYLQSQSTCDQVNSNHFVLPFEWHMQTYSGWTGTYINNKYVSGYTSEKIFCSIIALPSHYITRIHLTYCRWRLTRITQFYGKVSKILKSYQILLPLNRIFP